MPDSERPWVRIVGAVILGGATVSAALVPLYCAKQNRLAETTSTVQTSRTEIDVLKQRLSQDDEAIASKDAEIAQLRKRPTVAPDCPPVASLAAVTAPDRSAEQDIAASAVVVKPIHTTIERDIEFSLQKCNLSGTTLTCDLLFTSRGADRGLYLIADSRSRAIDSGGRELRAERFVAGANHSCETCNIETSLPSDVPMAGRVSFEGVEQGTKRVQLIEIACKIKDADHWHETIIKFKGFDL